MSDHTAKVRLVKIRRCEGKIKEPMGGVLHRKVGSRTDLVDNLVVLKRKNNEQDVEMLKQRLI